MYDMMLCLLSTMIPNRPSIPPYSLRDARHKAAESALEAGITY